ncbi:MAG: hypothetical protein QG650_291 [Patescibacteria group bacterium]|nr:hypothetical protein [Patescibacteria group bacterium]
MRDVFHKARLMKKDASGRSDIVSGIRKGFGAGIGIVVAVASVSIGYATYASLTATTGETLGKTKWNEMLQYTVPPGAVMAFNLASCPTNWSPADGIGGRPDLRGQFVRGLNTFDGGTTVRTDTGKDPDCAARTGGCTVGSQQSDGFGSHGHAMTDYGSAVTIYDIDGNAGGSYGTLGRSDSRHTAGTSLTAGASGGNETRPKNVALIYCIKN